MVKHIQTIRWQQPMNYHSVFDHPVGLALKGFIHLNLKADYKENLLLPRQYLLVQSQQWKQ